MISSAELPARLRAETQDLHARVERAGVMAEMLRGALARERYCALLRNLHDIYASLETALLRHAAHAAVAPVLLPTLFRQSALASDLQTLHGPGWLDTLPSMPAAQAYVARLQELARNGPELLAAHAYVRYLGDLSGGQLLRKIVARAYQLRGDAGTQFYAFDPAEAVPSLRQRFREGLAALTVNSALADALVAEARWSYARHGDLFEQLAAV